MASLKKKDDTYRKFRIDVWIKVSIVMNVRWVVDLRSTVVDLPRIIIPICTALVGRMWSLFAIPAKSERFAEYFPVSRYLSELQRDAFPGEGKNTFADIRRSLPTKFALSQRIFREFSSRDERDLRP